MNYLTSKLLAISMLLILISSCSNHLENDKDALNAYQFNSIEEDFQVENRSRNSCCAALSYEIFVIPISPLCCRYEIVWTNSGPCTFTLVEDGTTVVDIQPYSSGKYRFTVCVGNPLDMQFVTAEGESCESIRFNADCSFEESCCDYTSNFIHLGLGNNGCCRFKNNFTNNSDCTLYLYSESGNEIQSFLPGSTTLFIVQSCPGNQSFYIGSTPNIHAACELVNLYCPK